jgi:6-pyruvoyltetrahydropterin/6-carboxytetrahydropterin synthase
MKRIYLELKDHFSAAHWLRGYDGPCANLHGHQWDVEVCISGTELNEVGILIDFKQLKTMMKEILPDHTCLNEMAEFEFKNPTAENLAVYFFEVIRDYLFKLNENIRLERVKVWEAPGACAVYNGKEER